MKGIKILLTVLLITGLLAAPAIAKTYLVVLTNTSTANTVMRFNYHIMNSMEECLASVKGASVNIPQGGDAESLVTLYCASSKAAVWDYEDMEERGGE